MFRKHDVIAMVGLPARGKTFISKSIMKFLDYEGFECRIFNVGEYRRLSTSYSSHDFFSSDNECALQVRNKIALDALQDLCSWVSKADNRVAIYDATNSTKDRREVIYETVVCKYNYNLLFIESICDKPQILEVNIQHKTSSPDYTDYDKELAIADFKKRIAHYETRYKAIDSDQDENEYSYIQVINAGQDWQLHRCRSPVQIQLAKFLLDLYNINRIKAG